MSPIESPRERAPRVSRQSRALTLAVCVFTVVALVACGGGASSKSFEIDFPQPDLPVGGGGGTTTPPQVPEDGVAWNPNAAAYGRVALFGSFPTAPVLYGTTLFTVDADAIETSGARILAYDVGGSAPVTSGQFATTTILGAHLRDSAGKPGNPANPIGFGYFVDDILIANPTLGFALVNAGGSDSSPTLSNVVVFDPTSGQVRQTYDLATLVAPGGAPLDSLGRPVPGGAWLQSGAEAIAWYPTSATTGRLYVAMSNLIFGAPSYGAVKYPGTIQVIEVNLQQASPLSPAILVPGVPFVFTTEAWNPVALNLIVPPPAGGNPSRVRLLVTAAGTTGYDEDGKLVPVTRSTVEAYDTSDGSHLGTFDLGFAGLAAVRPALGRDGFGHEVGFFPSAVTGEIYLLLLDGLYSFEVDPGTLAVLRGPGSGIPITSAEAGGPGGNITGVALSPDGRTLAATGFGDLFQTPQVPGQLFLLSLPEDLVTGAGFGADFTPGSTRFVAEAGRTLGGVLLIPGNGSGPDVFVDVSGTLDGSFLGNGGASLGTLRTGGLIH